MDPLSIAASVAGLTTICVAIAKTLCTVCDRLKGASQVVNSLRSEARTISYSLSQLQTVLLGDADSIASNALLDPDLLSTVDIALTGYSVTLSCLEEELHSLVGNLAREEGLKFLDRAEVGWKDDKLKELLHQLRGQYGAIALLLNGLQMKSLKDIHRWLYGNQATIKQTASRADSLRGLFPQVHVAGSIFETAGEVDSVFGNVDPACGSEKEFEFDNIVTSSQAYRRIVAAGTRRALLDTGKQATVDEDLIDLGIVLVDVSSTVETLNTTEETTRPNHDLDFLLTPVEAEEPKHDLPISNVPDSETKPLLRKRVSADVHRQVQEQTGSEQPLKVEDQQNASSSINVIRGPREIMRDREARRKANQEERIAGKQEPIRAPRIIRNSQSTHATTFGTPMEVDRNQLESDIHRSRRYADDPAEAVREASKSSKQTAPDELGREHGHIDPEVAETYPKPFKDNRRKKVQAEYIAPEVAKTYPKPLKDNRQKNVQVEYIAPRSQTHRGEPSTSQSS